jgi:hypothetical protein
MADPEAQALMDEVKSDDPRLNMSNFKDNKVKKDELTKGGQYYYKGGEDWLNKNEKGKAREEGFFESICICICPTIGIW